MVGGGFTKEQLALAKQLQAGYCSSGTFHSTNAGKASASGGRSIPPHQQAGLPSSAAPPVRMPPPAESARSQPGTTLRSSNGLVRPLPSRAHPSTPTPAPRTASSGPSFKPVPKPAPSQSVPVQKLKPVQNTPQPATRTALVQSYPVSATKKTPFRPPMQSVPNPASQPSSQPALKPTTSQPVAQPPHKRAPAPLHTFRDQDLLSMEPLPVISTPTLVATPVSQDTEMANSGLVTAPQERKATRTEPENTKAQDTDHLINAPAAVREAIKINKMGKPVLWNYMTEAPSIRELSAAEKEEMKALPPPGPAEKLPWIRPWHPNLPLMVGPSGEVIEEEALASTRPVIGLQGSRHA